MPATTAHDHQDFDRLMRELTMVGAVALAAWTATGLIGFLSGYLELSPAAAGRFLLATLVLLFARSAYRRVQAWRFGMLPPDERYGFAHAPEEEHATGSSHP